jgi:hypothetical protein
VEKEQKTGVWVVTKRNLPVVAGLLKRGKGHILIAEPGPNSGPGKVSDVLMDWFDHPQISAWLSGEPRVSTKRGSVKRHGEDWQTGWQDDRQYILRPMPKPSGESLVNFARSFFERKTLPNGYEFKIGFLGTVSRGLPLQRGTVVFVPKGSTALPALTFVFKKYLALIGRSELLPDDAAGRLAKYVSDDLRTGAVFRENVQAGMDADSLCG